MKLDYNLTLKQSQKLAMTTKMIQEISILQYNVQELSSYVQEQMLNNPVLETKEISQKENSDNNGEQELSSQEALEYIKNKNFHESRRRGSSSSSETQENNREIYKQKEETLQEFLMFQLDVSSASDETKEIGEYIIETLDESGYKTSTIDEITEALGEDKEKVKEAVRLIRTFEPSGVCAKDLKDCLLIQMRNQGIEDPLLETIIREHLEDIGENRIQLISKTLGITTGEVEEIRETIKTFDPRPGSCFGTNTEVTYVMPDVVITKGKDGFIKEFKDNAIPSLMISSYYEKLVETAKEDKNLQKYLTERINAGLWLIKCIEKRQETIRNVIDAILEFQTDFFDKGEKYLKSLTLKIVAEHINVHESTVSRTVNGKYMQYDGKVYELKYFFTSGLGNQMGDNISSTSVKASIRELIEQEDNVKPLSDQKIVDILTERGIDISRRTVTKYRESMDIPSSTKRRRY